MARNLQAALPPTDTLLIHDLDVEAGQRFVVEATAGQAAVVNMEPTAAAARVIAEKSDTIITVLPAPAHVKNLFHTMINSGLPKSTGSQERLFVDCSTIDPASSREVANAVHCTHAGRFVDAPMSGGVVGAEAASLTFMLGAAPDLLERARSVLMMMGRSVHHCGEQGTGLSAKLANNYLLALSNIATAEAMNMGIRSGLDAKKLAALINASTGRSWCSEVNNPVPGVVDASPASRDYTGGFGIGLMRKDLNLALQAAGEAGATVALGDAARQIYEATAGDVTCQGRDFSVVYRHLGGIE
ncbi:MAG: hypothetical protein M1838_004176 [Thelocarpon superellum]|nr:MAG: hypothetical protein M1838_004176 [Thelocarpon superellum]